MLKKKQIKYILTNVTKLPTHLTYLKKKTNKKKQDSSDVCRLADMYIQERVCRSVYVCVPVISGPAGHQVVQEEHPFPALKLRSSGF